MKEIDTASVVIKPVATAKEMKQFVRFNWELYKDCPYAVPDFLEDTLDTFNPKKNPALKFCDVQCFLAWREGKIVGRVAAIINHRANEHWKERHVRFGWIDFIDDIEVSGALLKAVEDYGREQGMSQVVGPLGFTDMDPEGMLTWGYDQLGTMATIYNYPYYPEHMERLGGWEKDNDYVEFKLPVPKTVPEKYVKIAQMVEKRYNLHVKKFTKKQIYKGGYGLKMFHLINDTFKDLYGYSEMSDRQIKQYLDMWMPLVDFNLVTGIEDWNTPDHELIGIGITIPSLARALQKCPRGRLLPFGWWHVLRALKFGNTKIVDLLLIGVKPEYRNKGANALMFADLIPWYQKYGYEWGESQVEMETNGNVQAQWEYLGPIHHKSRRCFKKIL